MHQYIDIDEWAMDDTPGDLRKDIQPLEFHHCVDLSEIAKVRKTRLNGKILKHLAVIIRSFKATYSP